MINWIAIPAQGAGDMRMVYFVRHALEYGHVLEASSPTLMGEVWGGGAPQGKNNYFNLNIK